MNGQAHWNEVYRTKAPDAVSWYQPTPDPSLRALDQVHASALSAFIDVGGGASTLVDCLIQRGWNDLTVLDIAEPALSVAKARLGEAASRVRWIVANIVDWIPDRQYNVWHDRAVFHFLTEETERDAYRRALRSGVAEGGIVIIATFAPDGPEKCSGLPVRRYDGAALAKEIGAPFAPLAQWQETHHTPGGNAQSFTWCILQKH